MSLDRLKANASLEFPIYKYKLQSLSTKHNEALLEEQAKVQVELHVSRIVNRVIEAAESGKSQFSYNDRHGFQAYVYAFSNYGSGSYKKFIVPDIIIELSKKFPDSSISVDVLNTYILIDWS